VKKLEDVVEEKIGKKEVLDLIKKEYPVGENTSIDIRPLWGNCYRLNFWNKKGDGDNSIIKSCFISINKGPEGLKIKNYDDSVKNN